MTGDFSLAVHALVYLNHKRESVSSAALAQNICTNPARVRKVMTQIVRAGMAQTREGAGGGYTFAGNADELTLRDIAQAVDARFVEANWRSGSEDMDCLVASGMARVMDDLYGDLNARCMQRLSGICVADIDRQIFGGQA